MGGGRSGEWVERGSEGGRGGGREGGVRREEGRGERGREGGGRLLVNNTYKEVL